MVWCWAFNCNHYSEGTDCKFIRFPTNTSVRNKWKKLIRRSEEPTSNTRTRICSCHFKDGNKENLPDIFQHNIKTQSTLSLPEKKKRKRRSVEIPSLPMFEVAEAVPSTSKAVQGIFTTAETVPSTSKAPLEPQSASVIPEVEKYFLEQKLQEAESKKSMAFSYQSIRGNGQLIILYTGLPNAKVFEALYALVENLQINYYLGWAVEKVSKIDQLLCCLMKLRQNFPHQDMAERFQISQATVTNIVLTWVHVLHEVLYQQLMQTVPSKNKNKSCLPNCFSTFTNCRIVIDCTEVQTVSSRVSMAKQKATYSSYKHKNTWKALIGVAPNGVVTYMSKFYAGSTSDKKVVQDCGILCCLQPGDLVLADKGFLIQDILPPGVHVNIPPFLLTPQFTEQQVNQTERIARACIHVERAIRRIKGYKILTMIPSSLVKYSDTIFQVVGALTNLQNPLIKEVGDKYSDTSDCD